MTRILQKLLVFTSAAGLVFLFLSCDSKQPEPTINRVVKRPIKPEEIPLDPTTKWQSPVTPPTRNDRDLFPEPYPDLNRIIDNAPSWDGGFSIWLPIAETTGVTPAEDSVQTVEEAPPEPKPEPKTKGPYVVVLGTYTIKNLAEEELSRIQALGITVFLNPLTYKNRHYLGICHGGYPNYRAAKEAGKALIKKDGVDDFYVKKLFTVTPQKSDPSSDQSNGADKKCLERSL